MFLSDVDPINLATLDRAFDSFIELRYLDMSEGDSLYDATFDTDHAQAADSLLRFLSDEPEYEHETRRGILYLLNVDRPAFEELLRKTSFPLARWNPDDAHQLLVDLWTHIWGGWQVPDFADLDFDLEG